MLIVVPFNPNLRSGQCTAPTTVDQTEVAVSELSSEGWEEGKAAMLQKLCAINRSPHYKGDTLG